MRKTPAAGRYRRYDSPPGPVAAACADGLQSAARSTPIHLWLWAMANLFEVRDLYMTFLFEGLPHEAHA
jgi:hypothetical protein